MIYAPRILLALTLTVGLGALGACGTDEEPQESDVDTTGADAVLALTGDSATGEGLYASNCASCHAADGTGGIGPDLHDEVAEYGDTELAGIILNGYGDEMPAFSESLSDQEIADILAYITEAFGS